MTRQRKSLASPRLTGNTPAANTSAAGDVAMLAPLRPARNLTEEIVDRLCAEITSGGLAAGARLPTEQEMMAGMGVSRTVVREAFAALKAQGLVVTRQGSGAFVADGPARRSFRIEADAHGSLAHVLDILELRLAIELEAAALAAGRASSAALRSIRDALVAFERAIEHGGNAIAEDFALHRAIAAATANPQFARFLEFLGRFIIPRQSIRADGMTPESHAAYLQQILAEHRTICEAIAARDVTGAREAMRLHLTRSGNRYRGFATPAGGRRR